MPRLSIKSLHLQKNKKKISCLTAYTSSIAKIIDQYVDIVLIGDSLGTAIYGMKNTQSVTLEMMKMHGKAVYDSSNKAFTIVDMPYGTYATKHKALKNAHELLRYTKCQSVKLETDKKTIEIVKYLVKNNIKVVSHIGVNPQKYKNFDTIRSVGKNIKEQEDLYSLAKKLEEAGSCLMILECIKSDLAKKITNILSIPTIGIGASINCDGQVLVINDLLCTDALLKKPRFIKAYAKLNIIIKNAVKKYCEEVINKKFPLKKNSY
jgi:3-methyl-2-oxobutanoate hydroxymethyltransferase